MAQKKVSTKLYNPLNLYLDEPPEQESQEDDPDTYWFDQYEDEIMYPESDNDETRAQE